MNVDDEEIASKNPYRAALVRNLLWLACKLIVLGIWIYVLMHFLGCASLPRAAREADVDPMLAAWVKAGFDEGSCDELNVAVRWFRDKAELDRVCPHPGPVNACLTRAESGFEMTPKYWVVLNVYEVGPTAEIWLRLAHEWTHALAQCGLGYYDSGHKDPRLWTHYDAEKRLVKGFEEVLWRLLLK